MNELMYYGLKEDRNRPNLPLPLSKPQLFTLCLHYTDTYKRKIWHARNSPHLPYFAAFDGGLSAPALMFTLFLHTSSQCPESSFLWGFLNLGFCSSPIFRIFLFPRKVLKWYFAGIFALNQDFFLAHCI